jgi:hypothetical protein
MIAKQLKGGKLMEPMTFTVEEMISNFDLTGSAAIFEGPIPPPLDLLDPSEGTRNIRTGQDWRVLIEWTTTGTMSHAMAGNWDLQVFLEKMGVGEFKLMDNPIVEPFQSLPATYSRMIPFVAHSVSVPAGLYKVAVSLTMKGSLAVPCPIAAVAEGPVLQFYDSV